MCVLFFTFFVASPSTSGLLEAGGQIKLGAMQTERLKAFIWLSWAFPCMQCSTAITWRSRSKFSLGRRWSNLQQGQQQSIQQTVRLWDTVEQECRPWVAVRCRARTSEQPTSFPLLPPPPSRPSTARTDPNTGCCLGHFAGTPGRMKNVYF